MAIKVSDYMTRQVISISPDMGIREAFFLMKEHSIRHLPIVDENRRLIGIISDRELRRPNWVDEAHDISHVYYLDNSMHVSDVMIRKVHVLHTYDTLRKGVALLLKKGIGAAPVLDKTGDLVGMISAIDLLRALSDMIAEQKGKKGKAAG
ncbi:MAG: CBS domain-containing protein [Desulfobulbaceae bacterium]|jgi:acetoin utilization protein AcuB|nr:CBS domain-containing protein [Desulfobulbaceae bacterium]MDY0351649.1 CBS domain-containing protein [Desulfobulbaceae bacterium]